MFQRTVLKHQRKEALWGDCSSSEWPLWLWSLAAPSLPPPLQGFRVDVTSQALKARIFKCLQSLVSYTQHLCIDSVNHISGVLYMSDTGFSAEDTKRTPCPHAPMRCAHSSGKRARHTGNGHIMRYMAWWEH